MITFYPGPSKVYPEIAADMQEAVASGILSMNHRSAPFMEMLAATIGVLKQKLEIPPDYHVYFTSSATECWEIVAQSLVGARSIHLYNGAFGEKWFEYTRRLKPGATGIPYPPEALPHPFLPGHPASDLLCLTHNETSNGTAIPAASLRSCRQQFGGLIAVDATSSMAGVHLEWDTADVWFASVQKCFGLPSGLAVMVVSPRALRAAEELGENAHYNSLLFIEENFRKNQTPYTPNILGIYLLGKTAARTPAIRQTDAMIRERAVRWYDFFSSHGYKPLVAGETRSETVIAVEAPEQVVARIKAYTSAAHILLGNGYGRWKTTTFRIANFPAISTEEIEALRDCLSRFDIHAE